MLITFSEASDWNKEGIIPCVQGRTILFSCKFWSAISAASAVVYKGGQTVTTDVFSFGDSVTISDKTASLKKAVFSGYGMYVVVVTATMGNEAPVNKFQVRVQKGKATR